MTTNARREVTIDELVLANEETHNNLSHVASTSDGKKEESNFEGFADSKAEVLDFESTLVVGRKPYTILEPGTYPFTIKKVVKKMHEPREGGKLSRCWMAEVIMTIDGGSQGKNDVIYRLYWHPVTAWRISQLWQAVGLAKAGETFRADADQLVGKQGYCVVDKNQFVRKDGTTAITNEVKRCYKGRF